MGIDEPQRFTTAVTAHTDNTNSNAHGSLSGWAGHCRAGQQIRTASRRGRPFILCCIAVESKPLRYLLVAD
jgi:NADPH-dependent ferric siderophore reductase